ncbi:MAG: hypothetical protein GY847_29320 [Proteobacteria bacterium]|nr:hypothetical protein [Pseudomonadota bacterium]
MPQKLDFGLFNIFFSGKSAHVETNKELAMPRLARLKVQGAGAFYHLCSRTAGLKGEYPLDSKLCRRTIIDYIQLFSRVYCCKVLGFCVLGNHYHLLVWMEEPRGLSRKELRRRARFLYSDTVLDGWFNSNWERFEDRIFDVSELMRSLQSSIARWFMELQRGVFS